VIAEILQDMLAEILPADVAVAEVFADLNGAAPDLTGIPLFPAEEAAIANATPQRRRTFTTGRACARRALSELGTAPIAIARDRHGAPCWPAGIVGSITHCAGYTAAAVAHAGTWRCLGIDAEPHGPLPRGGVLARIASSQEQQRLEDLAAEHPAVCWDRLLFSAKESVYKAVYPLMGERLAFKDVSIVFAMRDARDAQDGSFKAHLPTPVLRTARPQSLAGRWLIENGLLLTAIVNPAPRALR
jgi:4'-phosphopantetheinyl transferase EntD